MNKVFDLFGVKLYHYVILSPGTLYVFTTKFWFDKITGPNWNNWNSRTVCDWYGNRQNIPERNRSRTSSKSSSRNSFVPVKLLDNCNLNKFGFCYTTDKKRRSEVYFLKHNTMVCETLHQWRYQLKIYIGTCLLHTTCMFKKSRTCVPPQGNTHSI